ncbi:dTMP kinase [Herbihabitans rhizosphaerae]|uniref:Thymidylate kinase n=1 Tax=Herbihabitans rhizosphaerae TaxID=1872711 RepID=A0A4Q7KY08_9PSEU|nr:dTMP kinase [Herbihabitans rhizosphaerae]RZS41240.1 dTMP kinase [Herbihabitans rhizosphaerae]
MDGISGGADLGGSASALAPAGSDASLTHRVRGVLAIRPFRRLWAVTFLCSAADWLSLLALTGLVTQMVDSYRAQSFSFAGVVLTQLLPGLFFAPLGGILADRFDRRKIMVICDLGRCAFLVSIAVVGTPLWLFIANFFVGSFAMMWIPSKDAAVPNLLRRRDQVETANQLGMVMTWGIAVLAGAGLYSLITGFGPNLRIPVDALSIAKIVVMVAGAAYLVSAILIATRIPELSRRDTGAPTPTTSAEDADKPAGFWQMIRDAARFVRTTPLVRGLLIGMIGALAAAGAVVGTVKLYANSLLGGEAAFGLLFASVFVGLGTGMAALPKVARRLPHNRLFGISIVLAGLLLVPVALSPHLAVSLPAVALVGVCAGMAFLTGVTIIGTQVEDSIRGRINAIYQSMMKIILFGATGMVPLLVGLVEPRHMSVWGKEIIVDGTRPVLVGAGVLAALFGVVAYRQMDDRRSESILVDLLAAIRGKVRRSTDGLLIAVEGNAGTDTAAQSHLLADWLRGSGKREIVLASDPALNDQRLRQVLDSASLTGARAQALVAAAVRADIVERQIRPALERGAIVVMERYVDSPLAHLSAAAGLDPEELEGLSDWATARLRPDVTVLLDTDPGAMPGARAGEDNWRVQHLLSEMAASDPDRYVVVEADGQADEVGARVRTAVSATSVGRKVLAAAERPNGRARR